MSAPSETHLAFCLTPHCRLTRASEQVLELLGYPAQALLQGQPTLSSLIHADDQDLALMLFSAQAASERGQVLLRLRHFDQRIRCVLGQYTRRVDADGQLQLELRLTNVKQLPVPLDPTWQAVNFVAMMENTDDFIYFKNRHHVFVGASQTLVAITHPSQHWTDLIGQTDYDVFEESYADRYYALEKKLFAGVPFAHELQPILRNDGYSGWVDNRKYTIRDSDGQIIGLFGVARDITEVMRVQQKLAESEQRLQQVMEITREGIWDWHIPSGVVQHNAQWFATLRYRPDQLSSTLEALVATIHPDDQTIVVHLLDELIHGRSNAYRSEHRLLRQDGETIWVQDRAKVVERDAQGRPLRVVGSFTDITLERDHQQHLQHLAHYDTLTGLPNRVLLADRMHQAMLQTRRREQKSLVAYLDLDGFKAVNDLHGHAVGDQLLSSLASRFKASLREGDTIARLGGDEFVAVFVDLHDVALSLPLIERLLAVARRPVEMAGMLLQVSASIGVSVYPQPEDVDSEQLLRQADLAMYNAKVAGGNRYHLYDAAQDRHLRGRKDQLEGVGRPLAQ